MDLAVLQKISHIILKKKGKLLTAKEPDVLNQAQLCTPRCKYFNKLNYSSTWKSKLNHVCNHAVT